MSERRPRKRRRKRGERRRRAPAAHPAAPSRRREGLDRLARLLLIAAACCLLALALVGPLELRWQATSVALLYHGAFFGSVLASALAWSSREQELRWTSRLFVLVALLTWAHTWATPLQDLTAWLARVRYLWLEV